MAIGYRSMRPEQESSMISPSQMHLFPCPVEDKYL